MKMTRRTLLNSIAAATGAAATSRAAGAAQPPSPPVPADPLKRGIEAIAKVPLPQLTEPAFSFKA